MRTLRGEKEWEILVFWDTLNACHSLEQEKSDYKGKASREKADSVRVLSHFLLSAAICLPKASGSGKLQSGVCLCMAFCSVNEIGHECNSWNLGKKKLVSLFLSSFSSLYRHFWQYTFWKTWQEIFQSPPKILKLKIFKRSFWSMTMPKNHSLEWKKL